MALSESTINDIKAELAELHQLKAKIDDRLRILEAALEPLDLPLNGHPQDASLSGVTAQTATGRVVVIRRPSARHQYESTGLRKAILEMLKARGPMRSPDVAAALEEKGFENDSQTPLATRVYNDLWRMSQKNVVKNAYGEFSIVE